MKLSGPVVLLIAVATVVLIIFTACEPHHTAAANHPTVTIEGAAT